MRLVMIVCLSLFFLADVHGCLSISDDGMGQVIFTNILYRHGHRNPENTYPNDPYSDPSLWPEGWGQLTQAGMEGHYQFGKWLRQRYSDLLPKEYSPKDIYIHSTDMDRTLMSAYCNLAGLYDQNNNHSKNWNSDFRCRPVPVHTIPVQMDPIHYMKICPKKDLLYEQLMKSDHFEKVFRDNKELIDEMSRGSGTNLTDLLGIFHIYDILKIQNDRKLTLPKWTRDIFPRPMKSLAAQYFRADSFTPELARLTIGFTIGEMTDHMEEKIGGNLTQKAWVYSAHDSTIVNVFQALNMYDGFFPPFNSSILLELREKPKGYFVTLFYRNSSDVEPYLLAIPGCKPLCPFAQFKKLVAPVIVRNWIEECKIQNLT